MVQRTLGQRYTYNTETAEENKGYIASKTTFLMPEH